MLKLDLKRLKEIFLLHSQDVSSSNNTPQFPVGLLLSLSFCIVSIILITAYFTRNDKQPFSGNDKLVSLQANTCISEEIDSLLLIERLNTLKPLLRKLPIIINETNYAGLVINLKKPLNIHENSILISFDNGPKEIGIILRDHLFFSNSRNPIKKNMNQTSILSIDSQSIDTVNYQLNLYKIDQLRLLFDLQSIAPLKIKKIAIVKH